MNSARQLELQSHVSNEIDCNKFIHLLTFCPLATSPIHILHVHYICTTIYVWLT